MRLGFVRVVGLIAEVLRGIVMGDVGDVGGHTGRIRRLVIIAFLEPGPIHRPVRVAGDFLDVLLHIQKVKGGVQVVGCDALNLVPHKGERQAGKCQVGRRVGARCAAALSGLLLPTVRSRADPQNGCGSPTTGS